jgi:hypothetical protein
VLLGKVGLAVGVALATAGGAACDLGPGKIEGNWTVEDARRFDEFPLYWLGEDYSELPLAAVTYDVAEANGNSAVGFVYGESTCDASGCNAPVWITIEPYCQSPPQRVRSFLEGPLANAGYTISEVRVHALEGYMVDIPRLHFWTGQSAVQINSNEPNVSVLKVAEDLIPISQDPGTAPQPLPPPDSNAC